MTEPKPTVALVVPMTPEAAQALPRILSMVTAYPDEVCRVTAELAKLAGPDGATGEEVQACLDQYVKGSNVAFEAVLALREVMRSGYFEAYGPDIASREEIGMGPIQ